jgi:predicted cupin superfamily sugar epimerase
MDADEIKRLLGMTPLRGEGGFFVETYRSAHRVPTASLPTGYPDARVAGTAIYYLLTPETCSALHRLRGDEVYHFYLGDPVEMLQLHPDGQGRVITIGSDLKAGMRPQVVAPGGVWQGSRLAPGGGFALMGTTMAPGFEFEDYESASRERLVAQYPAFARLIELLTP